MAIGIVGRKCGMTRLFTEDGVSIPVTVINASPNRVTQIKTPKTDSYHAIQVTCGERRAIRVNKPTSGHLSKAGVEAGRGFWEFRLNENEGEDIQLGSEIKVDRFTTGQKVDVTGITKGKGFAGTVKRHNFRTQDATHGNSLSHRAAGSIGQNQTPGRVFKGKKMAGHMGNVRSTVQNLEIAKVDFDRNLLLIKGAVPGAPGGDVIVHPAIKHKKNEK
ncbi:MAG TPA: 50S ribosomal protein L3 [Gammaproteobacteria bacterium]|nr:50S ribosomal protein L3 [Candidatus Parabeggiatoa sp.]HAI69976.1 50S ribosomal protein L3 [Gammaproteobacteria bacterium]HIE02886.1 50S ribosomal protein L3 [Thiotrichaceae bacterium]